MEGIRELCTMATSEYILLNSSVFLYEMVL